MVGELNVFEMVHEAVYEEVYYKKVYELKIDIARSSPSILV